MNRGQLSKQAGKAPTTTRTREAARRRSMASLIMATLLLGACSNLITGDNLKSKVQESVNEANAEAVKFYVQNDPGVSGGTPSLSGLVSDKKKGIAFDLSATVFSAYAFKNWTSLGSGTVVFSSPSSSTTSVTITKAATDALDPIIIQANYYEKPTVAVTPRDGTTGVSINAPLTLDFSQPMDIATMTLSTAAQTKAITLYEYDTVLGDYTNKTADYISAVISVSTSSFKLTYLKSLERNYRYKLVLTNAIKDTNTIPMEKAATIFFRTGTGADNTPPVINKFYVSKTNDSITKMKADATVSNATNASSVYLYVEATDTDDSGNSLTPATITISETYGVDTHTSTPATYQGNVFSYPLYYAGEGDHVLKVVATDDTGNVTSAGAAKTVTTNYDITPAGDVGSPSATSVAAGKIALSWSEPADADYKQVNIAWAGGSTTVAKGTTTYTTAALTNGTSYTFTFKTEDNAGNTQGTGTTAGATSDSTAPASVGTPTAAAQAGGGILLSWTEPVDADYKQVNITWAGGSHTTLKGTTSYTATGLTSGTAYTFTFKTEDTVGNIQASGTTAGATSDSTAPANVGTPSATAQAGGGILLSWTEPGDADYKQVNISWAGGSHTTLKGTTSYAVTGLTNGTAYTFTFKTEDTLGNIQGTGTSAGATSDSAAPANVGTPTATAQAGGGILLSWTEPGDADYKQVNISWAGGSHTTLKGTTSYAVTGLTNGTAYTFTFKTEDTLGNIQGTGTTAGATSDSSAPASVGTPTATAQAGGGILLSWTEPGDADYKQVNISWAGGSHTTLKGTTSYTATGLTNGTAYTFTFKTEDNAGNVEATGTTAGATSDSSAPASVGTPGAAAQAGGGILLSWTEPGDADYKQVNISWAGGSHTTLKGTTSYTATGLTNGTAYTFTFKTEDTAGNVESTGTSAGATSDSAAPANVGTPTATAQAGGGILLSWTEPGDVDYKQVNISWAGGSHTSLKGTTSYAVTGLTNGTAYTFTFQTEDTLGNIQGTGTTAGATSDSTAPGDVTFTSAVTGTGTPGNGAINISWTNPADTDLASIVVSWVGTPTGSTTFASDTTASQAYNETINNASNGLIGSNSYTITIKAKDTAGNLSPGVTFGSAVVARTLAGMGKVGFGLTTSSGLDSGPDPYGAFSSFYGKSTQAASAEAVTRALAQNASMSRTTAAARLPSKPASVRAPDRASGSAEAPAQAVVYRPESGATRSATPAAAAKADEEPRPASAEPKAARDAQATAVSLSTPAQPAGGSQGQKAPSPRPQDCQGRMPAALLAPRAWREEELDGDEA